MYDVLSSFFSPYDLKHDFECFFYCNFISFNYLKFLTCPTKVNETFSRKERIEFKLKNNWFWTKNLCWTKLNILMFPQQKKSFESLRQSLQKNEEIKYLHQKKFPLKLASKGHSKRWILIKCACQGKKATWTCKRWWCIAKKINKSKRWEEKRKVGKKIFSMPNNVVCWEQEQSFPACRIVKHLELLMKTNKSLKRK